MKFSQFAGTAIVPTLSRLVLALAFMTTGYNKLSTTTQYDPRDADMLRSLGVTLEAETTARLMGAEPGIVLASFRQDDPETPPTRHVERQDPPKTTGTEEEGEGYPPLDLDEEIPPVVDADEPPAEVEEEVAAPPVDPETVTPVPVTTPGNAGSARSLHKITLLCARQNWPQPVAMAWAAALTELVGGGLLLLGLFSRIWGLGLAITMAVAFYLVSMNINHVHETNPFHFAKNIPNFNTLFSQLGLFVLALGVFFTGPGPLSLDRLLFKRRSATVDTDEFDVEDDSASVGGARPV
ncbi:MAG: DoxX family protein [Phycisphaerales bacterium]|nr:DoxX family protein [Phycisphaerae bacterium]NNF43739.1 DoxX family protein [Phycisphaerales bacterium]NNM25439.1 DoxX family protein [Phycisphaerales bacterium]